VVSPPITARTVCGRQRAADDARVRNDERRPLVRAEIVDREDVRMVERRRCAHRRAMASGSW